MTEHPSAAAAAERAATVPSPAFYETTVHHVRRSPVSHAFSYPSHWWLVDLDALPQHWPWATFRAVDHIGTGPTIRENIDALLADHGLSCHRVLMLGNARTLGHVFNPLTLHYCLDSSGAAVAVVAEVHNTYRGRHTYVLQTDADARASTDKLLYVSPFHPVDGRYVMRLPVPGQELRVEVRYERPGAEPFLASVRGIRVAVGSRDVVLAARRHPLVTRLVAARIRIQGIRLWRQGLPVAPRTGADSLTTSSSARPGPGHQEQNA